MTLVGVALWLWCLAACITHSIHLALRKSLFAKDFAWLSHKQQPQTSGSVAVTFFNNLSVRFLSSAEKSLPGFLEFPKTTLVFAFTLGAGRTKRLKNITFQARKELFESLTVS